MTTSYQTIFFLLVVILLSNCADQKSKTTQDSYEFRLTDKMILQQVDSLELKFQNGLIDSLHFFRALIVLSNQEDSLFGVVRSFKFEDITEHNYWHRGRLKFPGKIKTLIRNMNNDLADTLIENSSAKN